MKYSGLYFISNPSTNLEASVNVVNTLVQGLESSFPTASRQAPWSLQYRLFRDTVPPGHTPSLDAEGKPAPFAHTLQHMLNISSIDPTRTYICIQPPAGTSNICAIPLRQQDAYALLVRHQFAALWQPRHAEGVNNGIAYGTGLCTVQIGELRSSREGPQSGITPSPGVLVCISTAVGDDSSDDTGDKMNGAVENGDDTLDFDYAQSIIRDCWGKIKDGRDLGRSEVREVMMAKDNVHGIKEKEATVRMWCDALRLRG
ncbi:hypothetical protein EK21DRAFT_116879 [Setomelanomma holmii]|uniref:Mediator of RNA polymerase II transcription subunit 20 n=1 Tax=Setomelanomma holmii TaxID=210430 RepID=A0A9P4H1N0_9PLEO|nr:hypothetical protein EK21DRAFT_116879 [Setomelanomma holmii]